MMPALSPNISIHSPYPLNLWLGGLLAVTLATAVIAQPQSGNSTYLFSHLAGPLGGPGSADGPGPEARFKFPLAVTTDSTGSVYVADFENRTIRKITPAGVVSTLATVDGSGAAFQFSFPNAVAADQLGNVYVADSQQDTLYRIAPGGVVTTFAGTSYTHYYVGGREVGDGRDGTGTDARFSRPAGLATDGAGNVYVADSGNCTIRKITPGGVVTTVAGSAGQYGSADGTGAAARFSYPASVASDNAGNLCVGDADTTIRKITPDGIVTTLAGSYGQTGSADGTGAAARFYRPKVTLDAGGNVYVADSENHTIRQITPGGAVSTLAGTAGLRGGADGIGAAARFSDPEGIAYDGAGHLYVADPGTFTIRRIIAGAVVSTFAGREGGYGAVDGNVGLARFFYPQGLTIDEAGNLYVADFYNHAIRKISPAGEVTTLAGKMGFNLSYGVDGTGADARFYYPSGVAVDRTGNVYVADAGSNTIRKVTADGVVTTLAGRAGAAYVSGSADGLGPAAGFSYPEGIAVDPAGTVYVADTGNSTIRKITPAGIVSTLAGTPGAKGSTDGTGPAARFNSPLAVAADGNGNVFVADTRNHVIRKITSAGEVTTLAGAAGQRGFIDGPGALARFDNPVGLAVDRAGNVFVGDANNLVIRKITPDGTVSTVGGKPFVIGSADGIGESAQFNYPSAIAVDASGNLYVADEFNHAIRKGQLAGPPVITTQPQSQTVAPGGTVQFSVTASSLAPVTYQWYVNGTSFSGAITSALSFPNAGATDAGDYTVVVTNQLGSVISSKATLTITAATAISASAPAAGGGGSIESWLALAFLALGAARLVTQFRVVRFLHRFTAIGSLAQRRSRTLLLTGCTLAALAPVRAQTTAPAYLFSHLAGPLGGPGSADGYNQAARFKYPEAMTADRTNSIYVVDRENHSIRRIASTGLVITLKAPDGTVLQFPYPSGVAVVDSAGTLVVSDASTDTIYRITPTGVVSTLAGASYPHNTNASVTTGLSVDANGTGARFFAPMGLAADNAGNVYVADSGNNSIRKITPAGDVTTVIGAAAQFNGPEGVALDATGNLYVADTGNCTIRKVTPGGAVSTLAGTTGQSGSADGTGTAAQFHSPTAVMVDPAGNVYVTDTDNNTIRQITPAGVVTTLAGAAGQQGFTDGANATARFKRPAGLAADSTGNLYVSDPDNFTIRKVALGGGVSTYAAQAGGPGNVDGAGVAARFNQPFGLAVDQAGNVLVADRLNRLIRKVTPAGAVTTLATVDGNGSPAYFLEPCGAGIDRAGNLYVADAGTNSIRKLTPGGVLSTLAGTAGVRGSADGPGANALFDYPEGLAVDGADNIYVADSGNATIRKITPAGVVSTLAGTAGVRGNTDGPGPAAQFDAPSGLAVDGSGTVYVADAGNSTIRKITPGGVVTTFAGTAGQVGDADGTGAAARFRRPSAVAVDEAGNVFVGDTENNLIRRITPAGEVTTVAGRTLFTGSIDGVGTDAQFFNPAGLVFDRAGILYVAEQLNSAIRKGVPAGPPVIATQPVSQTIVAGNSVQFSVTAGGVPGPAYQWYLNGGAFSGATGSTLSFNNAQASDAGDYTVVVSNQLGSVTSSKATLTITAAPAPSSTAPAAGGSGGGGSIESWFVLALLALEVARGSKTFRSGWRVSRAGWSYGLTD